MFGASDDPLHELVVDAGPAGARDRRPARLRRRWPGGAGAGRRGDRRRPADGERAGDPRGQQDRRQAGPRAARSSSISSASSRWSRLPPSTARASATCSTRSSQRLPAQRRRRRTPTRTGGDRGRDRRPAERRQVVAAQSVAARRAVDRQRHAGHDARHRRCAAELAPADVPDRRHRRHPAAGAGRAVRAGRGASASSLARRAIEKADVAVLVIDATEGATDQDAAIAGEAEKAGCGVIIAANKWDLMKGRGHGLLEDVRRRAAAAAEVPRLRADPAHLGADRRADAARCSRRSTRSPTARREADADRRAEPVLRGGHRRASAGQPGRRRRSASSTRRRPASAPPTFVFFTNVATEFHFSYERFLVNRLRESFGFDRARRSGSRCGGGSSRGVAQRKGVGHGIRAVHLIDPAPDAPILAPVCITV